MENIKNHDDFQDNDNIKKDHYHERHHILKDGSHDDVQEGDFSISKTLKITNKKSLIYHLTASGVFLALAVIVSAIDIGFESIEEMLNFDGISVSLRFLDVFVIMLSVGVVGPLFGSIIGFLTPILHASIHNEWEAPYSVPLDGLAYVTMVWILWAIYYVAFKNSPIHLDPNRKKDLIKRYVPIVPFIFISAIAFTGWYVLTIFILFKTNQETDDFTGYDVFRQKAFVYTVIVFGLNLFRCAIDVTLYTLVEPRFKTINHKFR